METSNRNATIMGLLLVGVTVWGVIAISKAGKKTGMSGAPKPSGSAKRQKVKILGRMVTVGSKEWERLTYQVKLFNQIPRNEQ